MAITERIQLAPLSQDLNPVTELPKMMPGLRVMVRTTSASFSDYPEWSQDERFSQRKDNLVTEGPCS